MRGEIAREHFTVVHQALIGGEQQDIGGAADLVLRVLQTKARFKRDQACQIIALRRDDGTGFHEDLVAVVTRELGAEVTGNLQRAFHIAEGGLGNGADHCAAVGVTHLDDPVTRDFLARDAQRFAYRLARRGWNGTGGHSVSC